MANSLQDLFGYDVFPLEPNWVVLPSTSPSLLKRVIEQPGTRMEVVALTEDAPVSFEVQYTCTTQQDVYQLLAFWSDHRGRNVPFWVKHPPRWATLKDAISIYDMQFVCERNDAHLQYQGYERMYLMLNNGGCVTRLIKDITYDSVADEETYEVETPFEFGIAVADQYTIGRLLFARFDQDELELNYHTTTVAEVDLRFTELVREYPS